MFRNCLFFMLTFILSAPLLAQDENIPSRATTRPPYVLADHLVYGGNIGLNFGTVTSISVAPMVGYKLTDKFTPGIGFTYNYLRFNYPGYQSKGIQIYGGSIWARYYILENIFLHGEYESLNGEWDPYLRPEYRYFLNSVLVGGGYRQSFGRLSSYILVLYNLTYSEDSPYANPLVLRVGFGVGL